MKRNSRFISVVLILLFVSQSIFLFQISAYGSGGPGIDPVKIQTYNDVTSSPTNSIKPNFKIYNTGNMPLYLSNLKIRYYYTIDSEKPQNFWCDYCTAGSSNVTGSFVKLNTLQEGSDYYLEIGFTLMAGSILPGESAEVKVRFSKSDWSDYNQSDDYSFNSSAVNYADWNKTTAYYFGNLWWGLEPKAVIVNPDFESNIGWTTTSFTSGATFVWNTGSGIGASGCISISNPTLNDSCWKQGIYLTPGKNYILRGYIKGNNIVPDPDPNNKALKIGANLSVCGDYCYSGDGPASLGTFDWKPFEVDFQAPPSGYVEIACRLGNSWSCVTGQVWFDNLSIIADDRLVRNDGSQLYLKLESTDLQSISSANLSEWINRLDSVYLAYKELIGAVPFNEEKIGILSTRYNPGGWAVAGNPIKWDRSYVASELTAINNNDDWSFGIMHEIGHDFDKDNWNWDGEFWANTKMYYAVETLNGKVSSNSSSGGYIGSALKNYYFRDASDSYLNTIGNISNRRFAHDGLTYCFIRIKERIGWKPFKDTFRYFISSNENPITKLDKFNRFLELLQRYYNPGGNEVESTFPSGELQFIRSSNLD